MASEAPARLTTGRVSQGTLDGRDPTLDDGAPYEAWTFTAEASEMIDLALDSDDFDAYLYLKQRRGGQLVTVAQDDDGGGDRNALLGDYVLERGGTYVVHASSYDPGATGAYRLQFDSRGVVERGETYASTDAGAPVEGTLDAGATVDGRLAADDDRLAETGIPHERWRFQGQAGEQVTLTLRSGDFDSYLELMRRENGALVPVAEDDDGGGDLDARLSERLSEDGTYVALVRSYDAEARGAYSLSFESGGVVELSDAYALTDADAPVEGELPLGRTVQGTLAYSDGRLQDDGSLHDRWTFEGDEGTWISVDMRSEDFDSYLVLLKRLSDGSGLVKIASNDDGGADYDARLHQQLPAAGTYVVIANSLESGETGTYTLLRGEALPPSDAQSK